MINIWLLQDTDNDYKLLEKWYQEEKVYSNFEQRKLNLKEIKEKYYPRTLNNAEIPVYMIEYQERPIGIIQYKLVDKEDKKLYQLNGDNIYEIDIFIGEISEQNKGIGTRVIKMLSEKLFKENNASLIVMCPLKDNIQAINCYKKCGFYVTNYFNTRNTIGEIKTYVLMIKSKNNMVERITKNEERLDEINASIKELEEALKRFKSNKNNIKLINKYYGSKNWFKDKEALENKIINVKAGVLSEDAVWDTNENINNLINEMSSIIKERGN